MKKHLLLLCLILATGIACPAQKKGQKAQNLFEEAMSRDEEPAFQVFVMPQIADVKYLSTERETFGPYRFKIKGANDLTEVEFIDFKDRAQYLATQEADADIIIARLVHSYISENDEKSLVIEITGYPAKYVNFRPLGKNPTDFEMIRTVYPDAFSVSETKIIAPAQQNSSSGSNSNSSK